MSATFGDVLRHTHYKTRVLYLTPRAVIILFDSDGVRRVNFRVMETLIDLGEHDEWVVDTEWTTQRVIHSENE